METELVMDDLSLIQRQPKKGFAAFFEGLKVPIEGYRFMKVHKELWKYAWIPVLLNTLTTLLVMALTIYFFVCLFRMIAPWLPSGYLGIFLQGLMVLGLAVVVLGVGVGLALVLANVFCSHFYGKLTRTVELMMGARKEELQELSVLTEIKEALFALIELCIVNVGLLSLYIIPGIGSVLSSFLTWLFDSYLLGSEFLDYSLTLRGWKRKQRRKFARSHLGHILGAGSVILVFSLIPVLGAMVLTTAVVGMVFLHRRLMSVARGAT